MFNGPNELVRQKILN